MKYQLFIDESGDSSLSSINHDFPVFALTGCLFTDESYLKIESKIRDLKQQFFGSEHVILHSRDIRRCEGIFAKLFDLDLKQKFYESLNKIMLDSDYLIVAVVINKETFINQYGKLTDDPYQLSLSFLLERVLREVDNDASNSVTVTIESRGGKEDNTLQKRYNRLLDLGTDYLSSTQFSECFVDMSFKRKIKNDIGLQIADLSAYPIARNQLSPQEPMPAYDIVKQKFRKSPSGRILGYGLKIFP